MRPSPAARAVRTLAIVAIVCWSLGPVLVGLSTSLSSQPDVQAARWVPTHANLDAYRSLLGGTAQSKAGTTVTESGVFSRAMLNSATITLFATLATLTLSIMAGYAFTRLRFRMSKAFFWGILATMIVPVFTIVVALFKLMADAHLIDTKLGLVLVFVSTQTPLAIWLFHNHIRDMPGEPEEAALIDGCTRWQAFYRVVVPQMRSGIAALAAILMLATWGEFLIPLLLSSTQNSKPATVVITELIGKYTTNYPLLAAAGMLALLPPAIVALVLNRHIRGMLSGAS